MMEERKNLLEAMLPNNPHQKIERTVQIKVHIDRLKKMLLDLNENLENKE